MSTQEFMPNRILDLRDLLASAGRGVDAVLELSNPHPLFDVAYYLQQRPDLRQVSGIHPLCHYLEHGAADGLNPHPLFDTSFYLGQCEGDLEAAASPLVHYLEQGWRRGLDPHPLFSTGYYLERHPDLLDRGINPLLHALTDEAAKFGDVSLWFDGAYYVARYPDLAGSSLRPLDHYIRFGLPESRIGSVYTAMLLAQAVDNNGPSTVLELARAAWETLPGARQPQALTDQARRAVLREIAAFPYRPPVSILLHISSDTLLPDLWATVESVVAQSYPTLQLCVAISQGIPDTAGLVAALGARHGGISTVRLGSNESDAAALNVAFAMASGHFVGVVEPGDRLHPLAIYRLLQVMQDGEPIDLIYGDEDIVDLRGWHSGTFLKPGWSPEYLLSTDFLSRLGLYRTTLVRRLGGWRPNTDPGLDLALRASRALSERAVRQVPFVVYHRKQQSGGPKQASRQELLHRTVRAFLAEEGMRADVAPGTTLGVQHVVLRASSNPLVSVVISTRNASFIGPRGREWPVSTCIEGLLERTSYKHLEIILVHDGNLRPEQKEAWRRRGVQLVASDRAVFNFSHNVNQGVAASTGDYVLLLDDDTDPKQADWLDIMLGYAQRAGVGVVGCKLFFPDGRLQHSGITFQGGRPEHIYYQADGANAGPLEMNMVARNCLAVTGACQLIPRAAFDALGGYDERLALEFNDVDFCLRAHEAGYRIVQAAAAELFHLEALSKGAREEPGRHRDFEELQSRWRHRYRVDPFCRPGVPPYTPGSASLPRSTRADLSHSRKLLGMEGLAAEGVNFLGPVNRSSGQGTAARGYVAALQGAGCKVHMQSMDLIYGHQAPVESDLVSIDQDFPISIFLANADATSLVRTLYARELERANYRIGMWVWELPAAGDDAFEALRHYDEIWVPSQFNADAFQPLTRSPVKVTPHALAGLPELPIEDAGQMRDSLGIPREVLMFLYIFDVYSLVERKNPICLLDAFEAEFGGREDVVLVLKVSYFDKLTDSAYSSNQRFRRRLQSFLQRCPNVRLITDNMSHHYVYRLINASDVYVSPHRSEGFGLTVAEAMFYAKTVIATDFGGTQALVLETTGLKLNCGLVEITEDIGPYAKGNVWADPSVDHLRELMQLTATDPALRSRLGKAAREHVTTNFSPERVGKLARNRLQTIAATL
ncbi:glycosyltransferase [Acidisphaera sp. L21]|uniref:glycosyltransferase n=1 Tax=Acidisphaera sp. L21 TaxID=1641851 RepID=UPI00131C1259|nr:glycosyltransferase [Acidisphaera sp. L21]